MEQKQKKDPFLAGVLSFIIVGAGQMYCGEIGRGIAFLFGGIVGYILFVVPGIIIHIWAIIDANSLAKRINTDIEKEEEHKAKEIELKKINEKKSIVKVDDFIEKMKKIHNLFLNEIIDENEYLDKKKALILELATKRIEIEPDDFLASLISLKEQKVLTIDEINKIKSLIN